MATRIVVGFDGSPESRAAVRWALDEAALRRVPVRVVTAVEGTPPPSLWAIPAARPATREELDLARERVEAAVRETTQGRADDVACEVAVIEGTQSAVLIRESADAALIVVGARGLGGLAGMLLGSVSRAVVEHAVCPVTIVR
jgi:nucleotide-binding universal stress UspA family protein